MAAYLIKLIPSLGNFATYTVENLSQADSNSGSVRFFAVSPLDSAKVKSSLQVATIREDLGVAVRTEKN